MAESAHAKGQRLQDEYQEDDGSLDEMSLKVKTIWNKEENDLLEKLVQMHGTTSWTRIAESFTGRTGKQCRERWHNHLENGVVKGGWSRQEDKVILSLQATVGNQWALISKMLPGRTDNAVKNRFHAVQRARNRGKLDDGLMAIKPGVSLDADVIASVKSVNDPQLNHELIKRLPHIFKRPYAFEDSLSGSESFNSGLTGNNSAGHHSATATIGNALISSSSASDDASEKATAAAVAKQNASHPDRFSSDLSSGALYRGLRNTSSTGSGTLLAKSGTGASAAAYSRGQSRADTAINKMTSLDILALVAQISDQSEQFQSSQINAHTSIQSSINRNATLNTKNPKEVSKASKSKTNITSSSSHEYFQSLGGPQRPFKNNVVKGGGQKMTDSHSSGSGGSGAKSGSGSGRTSGDNMSSSKGYFDLTSSSNGGESSTTYNPSSGGTTSSNNTSERSRSGTNTDSSSEGGNNSSPKNGSRSHEHSLEDERQAKKKRHNNVNESGKKINHGITGEPSEAT